MNTDETNELLESCGFVREADGHWICDVFEVLQVGKAFWIVEEERVTYRSLDLAKLIRWTEVELDD